MDSPCWALYIQWLFLLPFRKYAWCTCKGKITTLQSERPTQKFVLIKKIVSLASTQILHLLLFYSSPSLPQSLALPIRISEYFSSSHSHHPPPTTMPTSSHPVHSAQTWTFPLPGGLSLCDLEVLQTQSRNQTTYEGFRDELSSVTASPPVHTLSTQRNALKKFALGTSLVVQW